MIAGEIVPDPESANEIELQEIEADHKREAKEIAVIEIMIGEEVVAEVQSADARKMMEIDEKMMKDQNWQ